MAEFDNWQEFWDKFLLNRHGKEHVQTEDDLYLQVARTVSRKPVSKEVFDAIVKKIINDLDLTKEDMLVDFCCGNGLFTYELKDKVKQIVAVDFSQSIIDTANKYKKADNITYRLGDVITYMQSFRESFPGMVPNKYLMNDSLAYFTEVQLKEMLIHIGAVSPTYTFLLRGVPNDELKWNYYNTPERKQFYHDLQAKGDLTNDGLGTWWQPAQIVAVCNELGLGCEIRDQQLPESDYRMDIMITGK